MISFVVVIFYVLTIGGIFILRKRMPDAERPYKAFGYPLLPALYILLGVTFCMLLIWFKPQFTFPVSMLSCLILLRHHDNIQRLWRRQETKIWSKLRRKKKDAP
jgi:glycerol-3-phosphate acyltransferase PlsY